MAETTTLFQVKKKSAYMATFKLDLNPEEKVDKDRIADLLKAHLIIHAALDNPRLDQSEWLRLIQKTPQDVKDLLVTEGYFSPKISITPSTDNEAVFVINLNERTTVNAANLTFKGEITSATPDQPPTVDTLERTWQLSKGKPFTQRAWSEAKGNLLTTLLSERYPNAKIEHSQAKVDPKTHQADLSLTFDSGKSVRLGQLQIKGLKHYPATLIENINPIQPGDVYQQSLLLQFQNTLQETGKFNRVSVSAATQ
ncbi:MAG: POTRA domain-containing protein, partial [Methylophilus sp.]|nr:POTRA domain-containing protein [Methylophilus sp.]